MLKTMQPMTLNQEKINKISVILNAILTALCTVLGSLSVASCMKWI